MADGPRGWFKEGNKLAGNRKGIKNRATLEREAIEAKATAAALQARQDEADKGLMPLDFMLQIMRNNDLLLEQRFAAARSAAPYCHPQLQAIAHHILDSSGKPLAPVISLEAAEVIVEEERPKLTHQGPKPNDSVQ